MRLSKEEAVVYSLAHMYRYVNNLTCFCERHHRDVDDALDDEWNMLAIDMCISQIDKYADNIGRADEELFDNEYLKLHRIKVMRNIMANEYYKVSPLAIKDTLLSDVPRLREFLVDAIPNEWLKDPQYIFDDSVDASEIYRGIIEKVAPSKEQEQDHDPTL